VDGYHFDSKYQCCIKHSQVKLLLLDDAGKAGPYCADIVLNQNLHAKREMYSQSEPYTELLLGTRYVLLRRDFTASRGQEHPVNSVARRLLVSMGGSDPDNITAKVIKMLQILEVPGWEAIVVLAQSSPYVADLRETIRATGLPVQVVQNAPNMAELMRWTDLAITAGGTTIWELAFMGVPAVALTRGEHERMLMSAAAREGLAVDVGPFQTVGPLELGKVVASLAFDQARRLKMSNAGRSFVDGLGAARIVAKMGELDATEKQTSAGHRL
jgi:spore coat polysaccharide biosynthesis predicted glycosyltransferase SpsG